MRIVLTLCGIIKFKMAEHKEAPKPRVYVGSKKTSRFGGKKTRLFMVLLAVILLAGGGAAWWYVRERQNSASDKNKGGLDFVRQGNILDNEQRRDEVINEQESRDISKMSDSYKYVYYLNLAQVELAANKCDQAIKNFTAAAALSVNSPVPYAGLGDCLAYQGKKAEAKANYQKAISLYQQLTAANTATQAVIKQLQDKVAAL